MTDKQNKLIPKLRFPEFKNDGGWEFRRLGDIADSFSGGTPTASKADYYGGDIPFIRSGEVNSPKTSLFLTQAGLDCSAAKMVDKGTILYALYGATSGEVGLARVRGAINQAVLAIVPKEGIENLFLFQYLRYAKSSIINRFIQGGQGNLSAAIISNLLIPLPSLAEQRKIAEFLTSLDDLLAGAKAKREQLIVHKKGLMQRLFPAPGKTVPVFRLPEFKSDGEWRVLRLEEVANKRTQRNTELLKLPVLTNSAKEGVVNQFEYFDREIVSNDNLSNYFIVEQNDFVYNPRISSVAPVGPISRNRIGLGIVSPLYSVFGFSKGCIDFFEQYFQSNNWHKYLKEKANYGARYDRINISNQDFWALPIPFPSINEQQRIASLLVTVDEMIIGRSFQVKTLEEYKKGLMQQLFPSS